MRLLALQTLWAASSMHSSQQKEFAASVMNLDIKAGKGVNEHALKRVPGV